MNYQKRSENRGLIIIILKNIYFFKKVHHFVMYQARFPKKTKISLPTTSFNSSKVNEYDDDGDDDAVIKNLYMMNFLLERIYTLMLETSFLKRKHLKRN